MTKAYPPLTPQRLKYYLGARKRLEGKGELELVLDAVVDFGFWLQERRKAQSKRNRSASKVGSNG